MKFCMTFFMWKRKKMRQGTGVSVKKIIFSQALCAPQGVPIFDIDSEEGRLPKYYRDSERGGVYAFFMNTFPEKYHPPPQTRNSKQSLMIVHTYVSLMRLYACLPSKKMANDAKTLQSLIVLMFRLSTKTMSTIELCTVIIVLFGIFLTANKQ